VEGPCEYGNETSSSITFWGILESLSDWPFLEKDGAPSELVTLSITQQTFPFEPVKTKAGNSTSIETKVLRTHIKHPQICLKLVKNEDNFAIYARNFR
jgi:hypothetical protein